jgi:hypothetical protein
MPGLLGRVVGTAAVAGTATAVGNRVALKEQGILTDEELAAQKAKILGS